MNEIVSVKNKYLRLKKPFANLVPGEFVYCFSENENDVQIKEKEEGRRERRRKRDQLRNPTTPLLRGGKNNKKVG